MRFKKGFAYQWRWVLYFPYRLAWFVFKNIMAVIDSLCMLVISIASPTFTMFHGTSQEAVVDISRQGRWYVGTGNFAGSGVYFGRSVKDYVAKLATDHRIECLLAYRRLRSFVYLESHDDLNSDTRCSKSKPNYVPGLTCRAGWFVSEHQLRTTRLIRLL